MCLFLPDEFCGISCVYGLCSFLYFSCTINLNTLAEINMMCLPPCLSLRNSLLCLRIQSYNITIQHSLTVSLWTTGEAEFMGGGTNFLVVQHSASGTHSLGNEQSEKE